MKSLKKIEEKFLTWLDEEKLNPIQLDTNGKTYIYFDSITIRHIKNEETFYESGYVYTFNWKGKEMYIKPLINFCANESFELNLSGFTGRMELDICF